jgi:hypothetical protein
MAGRARHVSSVARSDGSLHARDQRMGKVKEPPFSKEVSTMNAEAREIAIQLAEHPGLKYPPATTIQLPERPGLRVLDFDSSEDPVGMWIALFHRTTEALGCTGFPAFKHYPGQVRVDRDLFEKADDFIQQAKALLDEFFVERPLDETWRGRCVRPQLETWSKANFLMGKALLVALGDSTGSA